MENNDLKKVLAGLSLVALIGSAGLGVSGCATTGSGSAGATLDKPVDTNERDNTDGNLTG